MPRSRMTRVRAQKKKRVGRRKRVSRRQIPPQAKGALLPTNREEELLHTQVPGERLRGRRCGWLYRCDRKTSVMRLVFVHYADACLPCIQYITVSFGARCVGWRVNIDKNTFLVYSVSRTLLLVNGAASGSFASSVRSPSVISRLFACKTSAHRI